MRKSYLMLFLVALLAGCGQAGPQWAEWKSPGSEFSASMPGTPIQTVQTIPAQGISLQQHTFKLNLPTATKHPSTYTIWYVDFPPGTMAASGPKTILETSLQGALEETRAEIAAGSATAHSVDYQRAANYLGRPALEWQLRYRLNGHTFLTKNRNLIDGDRLYILMAIGEEKTDAQSDATRFLDSFKILR